MQAIGCAGSARRSEYPLHIGGDRQPPAAARKTAITFDIDRISGNAGCNSFGGGYSVAGSVMTVTQVISTKMACMGAGMDQEDAFFKILATPMTIAWKDDGSVILSDDAGSVTLAPAS